MVHDEARRQAMTLTDAFNRRDMDAIDAELHEEMTHQEPFADSHLVEGKQAVREFLGSLWAREPSMRTVIEEVFTGPHGYAILARHQHDGGQHDGRQVVFVHEVDADGRVRSMRTYHARLPED